MPRKASLAEPAPRSSLKKRKPGHPEDRLQASLVHFFSLAVNPSDCLLFAVPNGEKRDPATAGRLVGISSKQRDLMSDEDALRPAGQGVLPGAPDLVILPPGGATLVEVKIPETLSPLSGLKLAGGTFPKVVKHSAGSLSKAQRRFRKASEALGYDYRVVRSLEEWASLLAEKGVPMRASVMGMV